MDTVLDATDRQKLLDGDDRDFYVSPRFVHHVDEQFRERLTALYRRELPADARVLDLMSSWVSHLPPDASYPRVVGHGLNRAELAANDRLDDSFVQNLNADQSLPFDDHSFDAVLIAVSVQYLQYPTAVFREIARVLAPGGVLAVSFSNRMFPQKAIRAWRAASMDARADLVRRYCDAAGGFESVETLRETPATGDPFYAVVARRAAD
ncbi:class I SAM-dependent methyltransferase [Salinirubrum litoreum]|uniref:Class I SAM-dependent methyltransferase n=1 Tax=Salinirubrum litoreum TaxID=1126234 RepID=A0ABD5R6X6_9EURY|nr:SAM-dependent methyltransferase [Salinirubrum litoreum]